MYDSMSASAHPAAVLAPVDIDFLFEQARAVAHLLSDRRELRMRFNAEWRGYLDADDDAATAELLRGTMGLDGQVDPPLYSLTPDLYHWRYDRSGRTLPVTAGVELPDPEGDPEVEALFIRRFRRAMAELVPPEPAYPVSARVDLATLAAEFHVLAPSPAWSEVESAVNALLDGSPTPTERRSLGTEVRQFAQVLRERADVLAMALLAGAAVGQAGRGTPEERLSRGLRVLSEAHRFAGQPLAELAVTLRGVRDGLRRVGLVQGPDPRLPSLEDDQSVGPWSRALNDQLTAIRQVRVDMPAIHTEADGSRRSRIRDYLATGARTEPRVEELLLIVRGDAGATVKLNLAEMTLRDWSTLAYASLVGSAGDAWLGVAALSALGFRTQAWGDLVTWLVKMGMLPSRTEVTDVPGIAVSPADQCVVVVRRKDHPLSRAWAPEPSIPALVLTLQEARSVLQRLPRSDATFPPLGPPLGVLAFEMPLEERDADAALLKLFRRRLPEAAAPRVIYLYADRPTEQARGLYVAAPRGVADLAPDPSPAA
jgi:hypothetical protein